MPAWFDDVAIRRPPTTPLFAGAAISFQPSGATTPAGMIADSGAVFATRNGLVYGWNATNPETRERNSVAAPDQAHDTLIHLQKTAGLRWELALRPRVIPGACSRQARAALAAVFRLHRHRLTAHRALALRRRLRRWCRGRRGVGRGRLATSTTTAQGQAEQHDDGATHSHGACSVASAVAGAARTGLNPYRVGEPPARVRSPAHR